MRVAALYDVHANLPALEAALADVPEDAQILIGGDIVGGPWPRETVDRLLDLDAAILIRGNADREPDEWTTAQLTGPQADFLAQLPETQVLDVDGLGETLFCHGSPRRDDEIITAVTPDGRLREILAGVEERTVVCGHTHHQFDRSVDGIRVVNAGSVGLPYEGRPGAYWALFGPGVELRRTEYDVLTMVGEMSETDFPDQENHAELLVTDVPKPDEVADFFERQAQEREAS